MRTIKEQNNGDRHDRESHQGPVQNRVLCDRRYIGRDHAVFPALYRPVIFRCVLGSARGLLFHPSAVPMRCQVVLLRGYEGTDTPLSPPSHPDARRFFMLRRLPPGLWSVPTKLRRDDSCNRARRATPHNRQKGLPGQGHCAAACCLMHHAPVAIGRGCTR